jgi:hypothetical protein
MRFKQEFLASLFRVSGFKPLNELAKLYPKISFFLHGILESPDRVTNTWNTHKKSWGNMTL